MRGIYLRGLLVCVLTLIFLRSGLAQEFDFSGIQDGSDSEETSHYPFGKKFEMSASYLQSYTGYQITSSSSKISLVPVLGAGLFGGSRFHFKKIPLSLAASANRFQASYELPQRYQPQSVTETRLQVHVQAYYGIFASSNSKWLKPFRLGGGLGVSSRSANDTAPVRVINQQSVYGPMVSGFYPFAIKDFKFSLTADMGIPMSFSETPNKTGYFSSGYWGDGSIIISYPVNNAIDVTLGGWVRREQNSFSGTGERGFGNGVESRWIFGIPVGLKVAL